MEGVANMGSQQFSTLKGNYRSIASLIMTVLEEGSLECVLFGDHHDV